jgi:hypothetical protein
MAEIDNKYFIGENKNSKTLISPSYKYKFSKEDGTLIRWGIHIDDNPDSSEFGPEIADIEVSTICHGVNGSPCSFCYKCNKAEGEYMTIDMFKKIFNKIPRTLTQIAFGIGDIDGNPDLWNILEYCRENEHNYVVPNITINGDRMTPEYYDRLANVCGAVAVSRYDSLDICYNAVKELTDRDMKQVNIHMLLSEETYESCLQTLVDAQKDPRLEKLNAVVFLALKPKGRGKCLTSLMDVKRYRKLIDIATENKINIGFDSCSAPIFLAAMRGHKDYEMYETLSEPCESDLFSVYINTQGVMFPCSFTEDEVEGINLLEVNDFVEEAWNNKVTTEWRKELLATASSKHCMVKGCRQCPRYPELYGG